MTLDGVTVTTGGSLNWHVSSLTFRLAIGTNKAGID